MSMTIHATFGDKTIVCEYCRKPVSTDDVKRCYDGEPHCEEQKRRTEEF